VLTFPSHTCELPPANRTAKRLTFPLCAVKANQRQHLHLTCTAPILASGMFSLPILLIYCNDRRIMGIQINQLCNMNMKFAALLLFVGVTSAMWCLHPPGSLTCTGPNGVSVESGQVTRNCCQGQSTDDYDTERGCDGPGIPDPATFYECCEDWGCLGSSTIA
jgi:hypothetical protein